MNSKTFLGFYKIIKLLELISLERKFKFTYDWDESEFCFSIKMYFEDGNFKMEDYTNMYATETGVDEHFDFEKFQGLYDGIEEFLERVHKIKPQDFIRKYLETIKKK